MKIIFKGPPFHRFLQLCRKSKKTLNPHVGEALSGQHCCPTFPITHNFTPIITIIHIFSVEYMNPGHPSVFVAIYRIKMERVAVKTAFEVKIWIRVRGVDPELISGSCSVHAGVGEFRSFLYIFG